MVAAGCNVREVSEWAGHNSVAFTLTRDGGLFEDGSDAAVDRLDALLVGDKLTPENVFSCADFGELLRVAELRMILAAGKVTHPESPNWGSTMERVVIELVDDYDGSEAYETVSFSLDGAAYEIDLSSGNAAALRAALAPFQEHARRTGGNQRGGRGRRAKSNGDATPAEIREWAEANGYEVSGRGRVSASIREAYAAAH